jgi:hypothetical protein
MKSSIGHQLDIKMVLRIHDNHIKDKLKQIIIYIYIYIWVKSHKKKYSSSLIHGEELDSFFPLWGEEFIVRVVEEIRSSTSIKKKKKGGAKTAKLVVKLETRGASN